MKIPETLQEKGRAWLKKVIKDFEMNNHELETVYQAAACLDRIHEAQEQIGIHGLLIADGPDKLKANPACNIERDNKVLFARLCRELSLFEGKKPDSRLPRKD